MALGRLCIADVGHSLEAGDDVDINPGSGEVTLLADIGAHERSDNPDPFNIDSNRYGIAVADDGTIYVNDAGGNTTYRVPAEGGDPEVLVVHPGIPFPEETEAPPEGNPGRDGAMELDPVPTGIVAADGTVLVGLLSGGPFPPGAVGIVLRSSTHSVERKSPLCSSGRAVFLSSRSKNSTSAISTAPS